MASEKQILANRANAKKSTGPRTSFGRQRSRRNALKHGLTGRAVVDILEDDREFQSFAKAICDQYRPHTPLQAELVHRLCAILWRLRRAHAIETGLMSIQARQQRDVHVAEPQPDMLRLFGLETSSNRADPQLENERHRAEAKARAFLRLLNFNGLALDQLNRYEVALWRQAAQLILLLENSCGLSPTSPLRNEANRAPSPP
jgi:hypothetical protein